MLKNSKITVSLNWGKEYDWMKKYEYKVITIATNISIGTKGYEKVAQEFETQLNQLGVEGWELVQRMDCFFFFKRQIIVE